MEAVLDTALRALSDPTRRQVLKLLAERERSAGELASHFSMSRPAVSQHLTALLKANLVKVRSKSQQRLYSIHPPGMEAVFEEVEHFWEAVFEPEVSASKM
jgi:DNA-binding transcriptional ArsR family regulator